MNDKQQDALKYMVSHLASHLAGVQWDYETKGGWDCREWHNEVLDKHLAIVGTFGAEMAAYYAVQYQLVCNKPAKYM